MHNGYSFGNQPDFYECNQEDIQRHLDENAKMLDEWSKLLELNESQKLEIIPTEDAVRHNLLKRKLHENLSILAKYAQIQIKSKKPGDSVNPNNLFTASTSNQYSSATFPSNQNSSMENNFNPNPQITVHPNVTNGSQNNIQSYAFLDQQKNLSQGILQSLHSQQTGGRTS